MVPVQVVEARRLAGEQQVKPDDATRVEMVKDKIPAVRAEVQLCLDATGAPSTVALVSSSCVAAYDKKILARLSAWRFRPFELDGAPTPICTKVTYVFRQTQQIIFR